MTLVCRRVLLQLILFLLWQLFFLILNLRLFNSFVVVHLLVTWQTCPLSLDKKGVKSSCEPPPVNPDWVEGKLGGVFIVGKICSQVKTVFTIVWFRISCVFKPWLFTRDKENSGITWERFLLTTFVTLLFYSLTVWWTPVGSKLQGKLK